MNIEPLDSKKWKEFAMKDLFKKIVVGKSKGLNHLSQTDGRVPYLGATNRNNGVLAFVQNEPSMLQKGNTIGFIRNGNGSVGYSIYKRERFISTSDISFGYADWLNKNIGLFFTTISDTVYGKYSFGYKRTNERLLKEKVMLPVDDAGNPDYAYMEAYTHNIIAQKRNEYINYISHISN